MFRIATLVLALQSAAAVPQVPNDATSLLQTVIKTASPAQRGIAQKEKDGDGDSQFPPVLAPFGAPVLPAAPLVEVAPEPPAEEPPVSPDAGKLVNITVSGFTGVVATLAVPRGRDGALSTYDAQIFAEKKLKAARLIPSTSTSSLWSGPYDTDIAGRGIGASMVETLDHCKDFCESEPTCQSIQFSSAEFFEEKNCYMFGSQEDSGPKFKTFQMFKVARKSCNIVTDAKGSQMICPPLYSPHPLKAGVCSLPGSTKDCDKHGLDVDCDPRAYTLASGQSWPNKEWAVAMEGKSTDKGATMKYNTGRWETNGAPCKLCEALCGTIGEIGTVCEAPSAQSDKAPKPCCFQWKVNGLDVEKVPEKMSDIQGDLSIAVILPYEVGFDLGLAKFVEGLPVSARQREKLAQVFWASGVTQLSQLGGLDSHAVAQAVGVSPAVLNMLSSKVDDARNADAGTEGSTLQILRNQGLFRGVKKMQTITETMLSPVVRLNADYAGRSNDGLSYAIAYTPDTQTVGVVLDGTDKAEFAAMNRVIEDAGFIAASQQVANGLTHGISFGRRELASLPGAEQLATTGTEFEKTIYFIEPHVGIDMRPDMLATTESFQLALQGVANGGLSADRLFDLYGTHTCPSAWMGGWMRYTGMYKAETAEKTSDMERKVNDAITKEVTKTSCTKDQEAAPAAAAANASAGNASGGYLRVIEEWKGGDGTGGMCKWAKSLQTGMNPNWRVVDRFQDKCIPHWYWVSDKPNLAYSLCKSYEDTRKAAQRPYVLKQSNVKCSSDLTKDAKLASSQSSLRECANYVFSNFGNAYFLYGEQAAVNGSNASNASAPAPSPVTIDIANQAVQGAFSPSSLLSKFTSELGVELPSLLQTKNSSNASNSSNSSNATNATPPVINCVALSKFEDCTAGSAPPVAWDYYQAQGVPDLCGKAPPGFSEFGNKAACPLGQYQANTGFPGSVCINCYDKCPAGKFLKDCGGTNAGTCELCESCPSGTYRTGCGGYSAGHCYNCPAVQGPFKGWAQSSVPCGFECFPPSAAVGNACSVPSVCSSVSHNGMLAHKTDKSLLAMGNCAASAGQVEWANQVVTMEAHCGDKFRPFRFTTEFLGPGQDNRGQWTVRDCDTQNHLTVVNKTLSFADFSTGFERFTFVPTTVGTFNLLGSGTQECIKALKKPGFQLMNCPDCCDHFVFAETPVLRQSSFSQ